MRLVFRLLERLVAFTVAWWVLSEGDVSSWLFGVPFVVFASIASIRLTPERGWGLHPVRALRFAGFFAFHSVIGGIDVAFRAIRPSMPIAPGFVTCPVRLPTESSRVLLADTISLLPGTLSSGFEGDTLVLHVLDCGLPILDDVRRVEDRIAGALGIELDPEPGAQVAAGGRNDV